MNKLFLLVVVILIGKNLNGQNIVSGNIRTPENLLFNNVQIFIYGADSNLLATTAATENGDYAINIEAEKKYFMHIYSNDELLKTCEIFLPKPQNATANFLIPLPVTSRVTESKKSVMSDPTVIQAKQLERMATNSTIAPVANQPNFLIKKESEGIRIPARESHQPAIYIDGMRVTGNGPQVQLPLGTVESIDID